MGPGSSCSRTILQKILQHTNNIAGAGARVPYLKNREGIVELLNMKQNRKFTNCTDFQSKVSLRKGLNLMYIILLV